MTTFLVILLLNSSHKSENTDPIDKGPLCPRSGMCFFKIYQCVQSGEGAAEGGLL